MKREELEHIIRASGDITDQHEFVIIGSQSILGPVPNPPDAFTVSMEVDIYPLRFPELADQIEGAINDAHRWSILSSAELFGRRILVLAGTSQGQCSVRCARGHSSNGGGDRERGFRLDRPESGRGGLSSVSAV